MNDQPESTAPAFSSWEIAAIGLGAAYLLNPAWRILDIPFFLIGALALWKSARATWPEGPRSTRATVLVLAATVLAAAAILVYGFRTEAPALTIRSAALIGAIYIPSAALQQYLTQGYLVGRLGRRLGGRSDLATALCGGAIFAVGHLPLDGLVPPTLLVGTIWSYAYLRGARFGSLVASHALLATLWFLAVLGRDPFKALGLT
jgi:hypothetical protein